MTKYAALAAFTLANAVHRDGHTDECAELEVQIEMGAPLGPAAGWGVILGFGIFFSVFSMSITYEEKIYGAQMSSEYFNTAGRNVGVGLTAAVIVSQWAWAATLLMSSNMGWRVGVAGPFWYASGATSALAAPFDDLATEVDSTSFVVSPCTGPRRTEHFHPPSGGSVYTQSARVTTGCP